MSMNQVGKATRRGLLGTAAAVAGAATVASPAGAATQAPETIAPNSAATAQGIARYAQASPAPSPAAPTQRPEPVWAKPAAMAVPKEGYFKLEQGRYGPIYARTPANYGFTIIAKAKPGREETIREHGKLLERLVTEKPDVLAPLQLHYAKWLVFKINGEDYLMYQAIFDSDFDKYTEDAVSIFSKTGTHTVFENLEGFPEDWKTNAPAFVKFLRDHQCPSFAEYGEYPYVSAVEVKKALRFRETVLGLLEQNQ